MIGQYVCAWSKRMRIRIKSDVRNSHEKEASVRFTWELFDLSLRTLQAKALILWLTGEAHSYRPGSLMSTHGAMSTASCSRRKRWLIPTGSVFTSSKDSDRGVEKRSTAGKAWS